MTLMLDRPAVPDEAPAPAPEVAPVPAWDPLRDPLWVTEALQWLTDTMAYLLVARACERHGPEVAAPARWHPPGELVDQSDAEQLEGHARAMRELWARLHRLYEHFERPVLHAPPGAREAAVATLHRPGLWPVGGNVTAVEAPPAGG